MKPKILSKFVRYHLQFSSKFFKCKWTTKLFCRAIKQVSCAWAIEQGHPVVFFRPVSGYGNVPVDPDQDVTHSAEDNGVWQYQSRAVVACLSLSQFHSQSDLRVRVIWLLPRATSNRRLFTYYLPATKTGLFFSHTLRVSNHLTLTIWAGVWTDAKFGARSLSVKHCERLSLGNSIFSSVLILTFTLLYMFYNQFM